MTPLYDALRDRAGRDTARFHMPGHKGRPLAGLWGELTALDFTELPDTGNLYLDGADGPIRAAERLFADACEAAHGLFLTGGATQGILALLTAFAAPGDTVIVDRNSHRSVHNALALLDLRPVWVQAPLITPFCVTAAVPETAVRRALERHPDAVCVLMTSPTYYGVITALPALAAVCRQRGVPLLVDAAHGAHLPWLAGHRSPVALGAQAAVLSAHKTLPALGQAAVLLAGADTDVVRLRRCAGLYGSSSPSYPLMASLDLARAFMTRDGRAALQAVRGRAEDIRQKTPCFLGAIRHNDIVTDPLRLCLYTGGGHETAARLERDCGVACEMADTRNVVFLLSPADDGDALSRLSSAVDALGPDLPPMPPVTTVDPPPLPRVYCTPREALFAPSKPLPPEQALGRAAAEPVGAWPPGVPLAARGEMIDETVVSLLLQAGCDQPISCLC